MKMPRIFCLTLKNTPERKEQAEKQFKEMGLQFEFIEGINGDILKLRPQLPNKLEFREKTEEIFLTNGAVGCFLSHLFIWKFLQFQSEEEFLIFEDDVNLNIDFKEKFELCYNQLPADWQLVYVGWFEYGYDKTCKMISENISIRKCTATHAYLIKKSSLSILLDNIGEASSPIDIVILNKIFPILKYYVFEPSIVSQKSIHNIDDTIWKSLIYNWDADYYHLLKKGI